MTGVGTFDVQGPAIAGGSMDKAPGCLAKIIEATSGVRIRVSGEGVLISRVTVATRRWFPLMLSGQ